jgi:soluble lytic murein transglycosylase-like protein
MLGQQAAPVPTQIDSKAAMMASVEKQRAALEQQRQSIKTQAQNAVRVAALPDSTPSSSFFTVPWPGGPSLIQPIADCDPLPKDEVDALVSDAASREGLQPDLLRRVMQRESAFKPCAISVKGAQGLMQLMPATADQYGVKDPFNPKQNVAAGARFLKELLVKYGGDLTLALSAYNAGPGRVDRAGGVPAIAETQNYVAEILRFLP